MRTLTVSLISVALLAGSAIGVAGREEPTTTEQLLASMVTEEVEPGVFRVVNDGVRDLDRAENHDGISVGLDGSIWLLAEDGFFRLGKKKTYRWPQDNGFEWFEVAPDGTAWGIGQVSRKMTGSYPLASFDGDAWTTRKRHADSFAIQPDGTVWATWSSRDSAHPHQLGRFDGSEWHLVDADAPGEGLHVSDAGDVWLSSFWFIAPGPMYHRVEDRWRVMSPPGWVPGVGRRAQQVGPDGTIWLSYRRAPSDIKDLGAADDAIARFDGDAWDVRGIPGAVTDDDWAAFEVAPDGDLWTSRRDCDGVDIKCGVAHFDGATWTHYLTDRRVVNDMDIAADGSVWLRAQRTKSGPVRTYVITPEAVAASE